MWHRINSSRMLSRMTPANMAKTMAKPNNFVGKAGRIELIVGPMFAGKTTELIRRAKREKLRPREVVVIGFDEGKEARNETNGRQVVTHDGVKFDAAVTDELRKLQFCLDKWEVIAIDEGQFFPDIVDFAENMANKGKIVIISALDGTFQRKPFPKIAELIPLAEKLDKLHAVCQGCGDDAAFSRRLTAETKVKVIGKEDKYMAVCRLCYQKTDLQSPHKPMTAQIVSTGKRPTSENGEISPKRRLNLE